jgi:hypothetical protein
MEGGGSREDIGLAFGLWEIDGGGKRLLCD